MISTIIAVYPGRFQPFGEHHATAFDWLEKQFGKGKTFIVTSNVVNPPKSPFNFAEKKAIISSYKLGDRLILVKNPYKAEELLKRYDPEKTAVVFMVGKKDMQEDPRFSMKPKKDGSPSYFQSYESNKQSLQGFDKHGYLIVAPHISINVPGYGEMSGTKIRQALGDTTKSRDEKGILFKGIFGWPPKDNPKLADMIFDKLEDLKESVQESLFTKNWWSNTLSELTSENLQVEGCMGEKQSKKHKDKLTKLQDFLENNVGKPFVYDFNNFPKTVFGVPMEDLMESENIDRRQLLMCGGSAGHMQHPFNIEWVHSGKDLVKVFQMSIDYLKKGPASVKIDGINASIRLITLNGKKTFVMDRGSNKPLDVKGITKSDLETRFGSGHGMIKIGGTVLDIFNNSIPSIKNDLLSLGLWDNPNILFNIEYVSGSTNVLAYNKNFLAIHGLLEIEQVTPTKRISKEIPYSKTVMQSLLKNLTPVASKFGYEVLGTIPTKLEKTPDLKTELSKTYNVNYGDHDETKTLSQWLAKAAVPNNNVKTVDGKVISALSKEVLVKMLSNTPLPDFIANPSDYKSVVDGFIIYLATMRLGNAILSSLSSPLGPVQEHEGIVIRDKKISANPFKLTGNFILGGLASSFNK
jgi:hypothetical protein